MTEQPPINLPAGADEILAKIASSDDPALISAWAELLGANAKLSKAQQPLFDKIVLRGLIPIALAVITPWALWKFDKAEDAAKEARSEVMQKAKEDRKARREAMVRWRERMKTLEAQRAAEVRAMTTLVERLDSTLKLSLIQMAVMRAARQQEVEWRGSTKRGQPLRLDHDRLRRDVMRQIRFPGAKKAQIDLEIRRAIERWGRQKH